MRPADEPSIMARSCYLCKELIDSICRLPCLRSNIEMLLGRSACVYCRFWSSGLISWLARKLSCDSLLLSASAYCYYCRPSVSMVSTLLSLNTLMDFESGSSLACWEGTIRSFTFCCPENGYPVATDDATAVLFFSLRFEALLL